MQPPRIAPLQRGKLLCRDVVARPIRSALLHLAHGAGLAQPEAEFDLGGVTVGLSCVRPLAEIGIAYVTDPIPSCTLDPVRTGARNRDEPGVVERRAWGYRKPETVTVRDVVEGYNRDDCLSTRHLRDWLEKVRAELEAQGTTVPRPAANEGDASQSVDERGQRFHVTNSGARSGR